MRICEDQAGFFRLRFLRAFVIFFLSEFFISFAALFCTDLFISWFIYNANREQITRLLYKQSTFNYSK